VASEVYFPVYVLAKDCGEITEFQSLPALQGYLEAIDVDIDVDNGEYDAWDPRGYRLQLSTIGRKGNWLRLERTDVRLSDSEFIEVRKQSRPQHKSLG
jgi:hypothetical protein